LNIKKFSVAEKLITFQGHSSAAQSTWFDRAQTFCQQSSIRLYFTPFMRYSDNRNILHHRVLNDPVDQWPNCVYVEKARMTRPFDGGNILTICLTVLSQY